MQDILNKFNFKGDIIEIIENRIGLINTTYVVTSTIEKYILQKINNSIFKNPKDLMENISLVTDYLKDLDHKTLDIIKNKEGEPYVIYNKEYWRAFRYIKSRVYQKAKNIQIVSESGNKLAIFHRDLQNFPANDLKNTIKDFHNTEIIFKRFQDLLLNVSRDLSDECFDQINYILSQEKEIKTFSDLLANKKVPLRVCHNDPKISNFLFDDKDKAICLIDLDTLMPGTLLLDIADAIRTICVSEDENESDITKLYLKHDYFESFLKSYLEVNIKNLNFHELNNIVKSVELIFLEQGIRFLTDYLNGNSYFKIDYKNQNLVRAKNQLYLSEQVAKDKNHFDMIVKRYIK